MMDYHDGSRSSHVKRREVWEHTEHKQDAEHGESPTGASADFVARHPSSRQRSSRKSKKRRDEKKRKKKSSLVRHSQKADPPETGTESADIVPLRYSRLPTNENDTNDVELGEETRMSGKLEPVRIPSVDSTFAITRGHKEQVLQPGARRTSLQQKLLERRYSKIPRDPPASYTKSTGDLLPQRSWLRLKEKVIKETDLREKKQEHDLQLHPTLSSRQSTRHIVNDRRSSVRQITSTTTGRVPDVTAPLREVSPLLPQHKRKDNITGDNKDKQKRHHDGIKLETATTNTTPVSTGVVTVGGRENTRRSNKNYTKRRKMIGYRVQRDPPASVRIEHVPDTEPQPPPFLQDVTVNQDIPRIEQQEHREENGETETTQLIPGAFAVHGSRLVPRVTGQGDEESFATEPAATTEQTILVEAELTSDNLHEENEALNAENEYLRARLDDQPELVQAEVALAGTENSFLEKDRRNKNKRFTIFAILALVAIVVAVAVPLSIQSPNNEDPPAPPTRSPSTSPSFSPSASPSLSPIWEQLGQDLNGTDIRDFFGLSISLSRDANVVAVGADQAQPDPGFVSVFQFNAQSQSWTPMGQTLVGEGGGDDFGWSVSLNRAGNILAVGAIDNDGGGEGSGQVQVYEYNSTSAEWVPLGSDIDGKDPEDEFGRSVALSDTGDTLVVGASGRDTDIGGNSGSVDVFQYNRDTSSWEELGPTLPGQAVNDAFGFSVSMSSSGEVVAIGAPENDAGGNNAGQVSVFEYNSNSSEWVPMGTPMNGQIINGGFGLSVSLSDSGFVVAVGAPGLSDSVLETVQIYEFDSTASSWIQRGNTLEGEAVGDDFGMSVSLSQDGNMVAVGLPRSRDAAGVGRSGQVRIYEYDSSTTEWKQVGETLFGEAAGDRFGRSVFVSGNNETVVGVGAWRGDPNGLDLSGYVRVFSL